MTVEMTPFEAEILIGVLAGAEGIFATTSPELSEALKALRPYRSALIVAYLKARVAEEALGGAAGAAVTDKTRTGLYRKFDVRRTDGTDVPGGKHDGCSYFVLDLTHDKHAIPAIRAYAKSCRVEFPMLAVDLESLADGNPLMPTRTHLPKP